MNEPSFKRSPFQRRTLAGPFLCFCGGLWACIRFSSPLRHRFFTSGTARLARLFFVGRRFLGFAFGRLFGAHVGGLGGGTFSIL